MGEFIKQNNSSFKDQLICEAFGLKLLAKYSTTLKIPKVYSVDSSTLKMETINSIAFNDEGMKKLATGLAQIHKNNAPSFGLEEDNYIGLNPQINEHSEYWGSFFFKNRLMYQAGLSSNKDITAILVNHKHKIINYLNAHSPHPSPVHGDLWSGNALWDGSDAWLIDPAFYYGDREVDIAMTKMFGGFSPIFYETYEREYSLPIGHETRSVIYNLYHYLNHYNLFGSSYLSGVENALELIESI